MFRWSKPVAILYDTKLDERTTFLREGAQMNWLTKLVLPPILGAIGGAIATFFLTQNTYKPAQITFASIDGDAISVRFEGDIHDLTNGRIILVYSDPVSRKGTSQRAVPIKLIRDSSDPNSFTDSEGLSRRCEVIDPCPDLSSIVSVVLEVKRASEGTFAVRELEFPKNG